MDTTPGSTKASIVERAKAIILTPSQEWPRIAADDATTREVLTRYVIPLAAIGPIAGFISGQIFGYPGFNGNFQPGLIGGILLAVMSFFVSLIILLLLALLAFTLAPKFGGELNQLRSFKLVAYASTASYLAAIFTIVPRLELLSLLGLYSIYLFHVGTNPMLGVPKNKAIGFTALIFVGAIALNILVVLMSTANVVLLDAMGVLSHPAPVVN